MVHKQAVAQRGSSHVGTQPEMSPCQRGVATWSTGLDLMHPDNPCLLQKVSWWWVLSVIVLCTVILGKHLQRSFTGLGNGSAFDQRAGKSGAGICFKHHCSTALRNTLVLYLAR